MPSLKLKKEKCLQRLVPVSLAGQRKVDLELRGNKLITGTIHLISTIIVKHCAIFTSSCIYLYTSIHRYEVFFFLIPLCFKFWIYKLSAKLMYGGKKLTVVAFTDGNWGED